MESLQWCAVQLSCSSHFHLVIEPGGWTYLWIRVSNWLTCQIKETVHSCSFTRLPLIPLLWRFTYHTGCNIECDPGKLILRKWSKLLLLCEQRRLESLEKSPRESCFLAPKLNKGYLPLRSARLLIQYLAVVCLLFCLLLQAGNSLRAGIIIYPLPGSFHLSQTWPPEMLRKCWMNDREW